MASQENSKQASSNESNDKGVSDQPSQAHPLLPTQAVDLERRSESPLLFVPDDDEEEEDDGQTPAEPESYTTSSSHPPPPPPPQVTPSQAERNEEFLTPYQSAAGQVPQLRPRPRPRPNVVQYSMPPQEEVFDDPHAPLPPLPPRQVPASVDINRSRSRRGEKKRAAPEEEDDDEDEEEEEEPAAQEKKSTGRKKKAKASQKRKRKRPVDWHQPSRGAATLEELQQIREDLNNHIYRGGEGSRTDRVLTEDHVRQALHSLAFVDGLNGDLIRRSGLFDPGQGFSAIADMREGQIASDIRDYARELRNRFHRGIFTSNLWYGLRYNGRWSDDPAFKKVDSRYRGAGNLINGQWWPSRLAACRDGAHGNTQKGIHGSSKDGAYSIVCSGGSEYSGDQDGGDTITYDGEKSKPKSGKTVVPSSNNHLITAHKNGYPVRVLRSSNLPETNPYRPSFGLRYDGLYRVTAVHEQPEGNTISHIFDLQRIPGQEPIRRTGTPGARPTADEVEEYETSRGQQTLASQRASTEESDDDSDNVTNDQGDGQAEVRAEVEGDGEAEQEDNPPAPEQS